MRIMKLIFATHNPGKVKEIKMMLAGLDVEVVGQEEVGVHEEVVEDRKTFEGNALKKARFVAVKTGQWAVADDSGICIDALDGAPGIHSARWAGEGASDEEIVCYTLEKMKNVPEDKRGAWFETAFVLLAPDGRQRTFYGKVDGSIATEPRGANRPKLPYDPIFIPDGGGGRTFAEMTDVEKNTISHRGRAFVQLKGFLKTIV